MLKVLCCLFDIASQSQGFSDHTQLVRLRLARRLERCINGAKYRGFLLNCPEARC